ncbi:uncharacterized membrane protein YgaE (UPF0421/DUF939 family) [Clostridium punense]|uniref:Uncharacterized membrane protein YgaE (UPF0421/DUF939 family) n=1 Tax=Clostridium punense TaxID=1054297 RepID=A0ABS4K2M3_9CLOT|nr:MULTISPECIES: hypothetical protein [Clostridium]EQB86020.1 hypothetical protein M918_16365 [Clostridium sp. BL8]MBP2021376.1 uncharacterized membrane protein YgaE (UPF0421/DUF939 family) [Clostridium punense]
MKKAIKFLGLSDEAILLDTKLYIIKSMLAISTGYLLGIFFPITRLDMISVLLGVMYNLEPINVLGIKGGISQLVASTIGAACTGILILVFGINVFTIALGMALTLYVSIKINWRMVSPVAIFTCIYMTQYVQRDIYGMPSIWLTFRLRIAALGLGVIIAIFYNYVFSHFYYHNIASKRLQFAKKSVLSGLEYTYRELKSSSENKNRDYVTIFPTIFNDLDLVHANMEVMVKESKFLFHLLEPKELAIIQNILQHFRDINHLTYDINYTAWREGQNLKLEDNVISVLEEIIEALKDLNFTKIKTIEHQLELKTKLDKDFNGNRITSNINSIVYYVEEILEETKAL